MSIFKLACFFILLKVLAISWAEERPLVNTPYGKVRGYTMMSRSGRRFFAFSGIRYAKPPVGKYALSPPRPLQPWKGVWDAINDGPMCVQMNLFQVHARPEGVLDCLHLSIYTHKFEEGNAPVLIHFHGGGFIAGDISRSGPQYLMDEDIVIVNVNYRLGVYGFLSFEDAIMPGNQGLKDQVIAMKWIKKSIASFGGDPNDITIMGESAGAASVYHHIVSPLSKGLFQKAIAESGTSYNSWALAPPGFARNKSLTLMKLIGCDYESTADFISCIVGMDPLYVVYNLVLFREWEIDPICFIGPVLEPPGDESFLVGPIDEWKHDPVPLLMGTTSAEGLIRTLHFIEYNLDFKWYSDHFTTVAPLSLGYYARTSNPEEITEQIRQFYFKNNEIKMTDWKNITTMYSDALLGMNILEGADKHPGEIFFYYFDYLGELSFAGNRTTRNDTIVFGACHTDEVIYLWQQQYLPPLQGEDLELSKTLVKMWTNFVKFGAPTLEDSIFQWDIWTPTTHRYAYICNDGFFNKEGLAEDRYSFWSSLLQSNDCKSTI